MARTVVLLLAGGQGSRLGILARKRAKPAVPFGGIYRIIDFTLSNVANSGLGRVGVLTQYRPSSLMDHLGIGEAWDLARRGGGLRVLPPHTGAADEDWYKGTADAVWQNRAFLEGSRAERVLVVSGDHIYKMDYRALLDFHQRSRAAATVAVMEVTAAECSRFGILRLAGDGRVTDFWEKPSKPVGTLGSMGVYVFERQVLDQELDAVVRRGRRYDFGADVIPQMIGRRRVFGYLFSGYWRDVGTFDSYFDCHHDLLEPDSGLDLAAWGVRTNIEGRELAERAPAWLAASAVVEDALISPGCAIHGRVVRSVLSPGVVVGRGALVSDSVLLHDCEVGDGAQITRVIADKDVRIGAAAVVGGAGDAVPNQRTPGQLHSGLSVLGKGAVVPALARIGRNCVVDPDVGEHDFPEQGLTDGECCAVRERARAVREDGRQDCRPHRQPDEETIV